jgi:hypothetical protein
MVKVKYNIAVVISDGVGYRNFILSRFLRKASEHFERVEIFSYLPRSVYELSEYSNVSVHECEIRRESIYGWFFRKTKEIAHLRKNSKGNFGIRDNYNANKPRNFQFRSILTRIIFIITRFFNSESFIKFLEKCQLYALDTNSFQQIKTTLQSTDYVFFSHQRPPFVLPILKIAQEKNIKTGAFIFSWDNLPSKGRMLGDFNHYYVWSDLMRNDLMEFYPSINERRVSVVGTPQFECYSMRDYVISKEEFYARFDIPIQKRIITYSCGDITTSKNDELYIRVLYEALILGKFVENLVLLVRISPAENKERFSLLQKQCEQIMWNFPDWNLVRETHPEPWSQRVPSRRDMEDLQAILTYSEIGINMCSTMSLDFMLFNKPVINPVFGNANNGLYDDQRFLKYRHYQTVVDSGAVSIVTDEEALISSVVELLSNPTLRLVNQEQLKQQQIGIPLAQTSEKFIAEIGKNIEKDSHHQ